MDSQGSVSSVVSESGRDWLDLIDTPDDFSEQDREHIEETVRTYFDFTDLTERDVDENESVAGVNDSDTDFRTDVDPSAAAGDDNLPAHEDEFLDMSSEDVRETVVRNLNLDQA